MLKYFLNVYSLGAVLFIILASLQYELWFGEGGVTDITHLNQVINVIEENNTLVANHNRALQANINDLKNGQDASEEEARSELGMVKPGENYYQIIGKNDK